MQIGRLESAWVCISEHVAAASWFSGRLSEAPFASFAQKGAYEQKKNTDCHNEDAEHESRNEVHVVAQNTGQLIVYTLDKALYTLDKALYWPISCLHFGQSL